VQQGKRRQGRANKCGVSAGLIRKTLLSTPGKVGKGVIVKQSEAASAAIMDTGGGVKKTRCGGKKKCSGKGTSDRLLRAYGERREKIIENASSQSLHIGCERG